MDPEAVKRSLEQDAAAAAAVAKCPPYDALVLRGLRIDAAEPGRVVCSFSVPPRLAGSDGYLLSGATATLADVVGSAVFYSSGLATSGVSVDISVSYVDAASIGEEIEIEAKLLRAGKSVGVSSIDFRKKDGKMIAQARHTKYLAVSSKL